MKKQADLYKNNTQLTSDIFEELYNTQGEEILEKKKKTI